MTSTPATARSLPSAGIMLMCAAVFLSPLIDIFAKLAVATVPAGEVTAVRFFFQAGLVLPFALMRGNLFSRSPRQILFHFIRGFLLVTGMTAIAHALKVMPVADAIAIFFVEPAILTLMSAIFLKEHIGRNKIVACATGFGGSLLVIQPSFSQFGFISLLPVVTAFTLAIYLLMTRALSRNEDPWSMQFQSSLWGMAMAVMSLALGYAADWQAFYPVFPDMKTLFYLGGVGVAATVSGMLSVYAYRAMAASVLAPLQYLEIVSACIFAYWVFGDFPDTLKWYGIASIIGSGLFIILKEDRQSISVTEV